jgi:transcriptional regulator with XRE-family HTH domain
METKNYSAVMQEVRRKRLLHRIPGRLLCARAPIDRSRLSELERAYAIPSADELERLQRALDQLVTAKEQVEKFAATVGWPGGVRA